MNATHLPAHCTSMGSVLLAELPCDEALGRIGAPIELRTELTITDPAAFDGELTRVRTQGWALINEERERRLRSLAGRCATHRGARSQR